MLRLQERLQSGLNRKTLLSHVKQSLEFEQVLALFHPRHTAAQGRGFVKIKLLPRSQNGGVDDPGWATNHHKWSLFTEG